MRTLNGNIAEPTGRTAAYIIAATDATVTEKLQADVVCDGTADNVEWQAALDAGYKNIQGVGTTFTFATVVSKAVNDVTITGEGYTIFNRDAANPLFSAGAQTGWKFRNLKTDAGGITQAADTMLEKVTIGATFYSLKTSTALSAGITGNAVTATTATSATTASTLSNKATVIKQSDETVNNSDALQNDDELLYALTANQQIAFELLLLYNTTNAAGLKIGWTVPAGATLTWGGTWYNNTGDPVTVANYTAASTAAFYGSSTAPQVARVHGYITNGATPGNLQLQWAQYAATAVNSKVLKGAKLEITLITGSVAAPANTVITVSALKTAAESRNNTTTMTDDAELKVPVLANKSYSFFFWGKVISASSVTPDIKYRFEPPANGILNWFQVGDFGLLTSDDSLEDCLNSQAGGAEYATGQVINTDVKYILCWGMYTGGATAGYVTFQWAQNVATAENVSMQPGSYILMTLLN